MFQLLLLFSLSGYRYLGDGGTDRREILHDSTHRSRTGFPLLRVVLPGISKSEILVLNFGHLIAIILKTVGCMFTCQLELSKNASHRAVAAPGESIISKNVLDFFTIFASSSGINVINPLPHQWILVYHVLDAIVHRGSVVFT